MRTLKSKNFNGDKYTVVITDDEEYQIRRNLKDGSFIIFGREETLLDAVEIFENRIDKLKKEREKKEQNRPNCFASCKGI